MFFINNSLKLIITGDKIKIYENLPIWWNIVMGLSCLSYLFPCFVMYHFYYFKMSILFFIITVFSFLGDTIQVNKNYIRSLDRFFGLLGILFSIFINSLNLFYFIKCIFLLIPTLWWLKKSRETSILYPNSINKYLFYHSIWHLWGSLTVCFVTFINYSQTPILYSSPYSSSILG